MYSQKTRLRLNIYTDWKLSWRLTTTRYVTRLPRGRLAVGRHHSHEMALQQDREKVVREKKLRVARLLPPAKPPMKERLGDTFVDRLGEQGRERIPRADYPKKKKNEGKRHKNNQCGVHGYIRKDCPDLPPKEGGGKREENKRVSTKQKVDASFQTQELRIDLS